MLAPPTADLGTVMARSHSGSSACMRRHSGSPFNVDHPGTVDHDESHWITLVTRSHRESRTVCHISSQFATVDITCAAASAALDMAGPGDTVTAPAHTHPPPLPVRFTVRVRCGSLHGGVCLYSHTPPQEVRHRHMLRILHGGYIYVSVKPRPSLYHDCHPWIYTECISHRGTAPPADRHILTSQTTRKLSGL